MIKISLHESGSKKDIIELEFDNSTTAHHRTRLWLSKVVKLGNAFVCFPKSKKTFPTGYTTDDAVSLLVSAALPDILEFANGYYELCEHLPIHIVLFQYESFQSALDYCKDYKEGS
jgi:hypothetical protein